MKGGPLLSERRNRKKIKITEKAYKEHCMHKEIEITRGAVVKA